ncbi:Os10g0344600 [Oryza sativa Japonica Group]|uniref:Os10g0344600 protein n=1 Tax=Oryza sativa subsp. japonica TaxID=39947 RepID=A0A0P0XTZ0_ORYSJ|nr:Os10g0344600 [Oryza sativa Japonica Group]
MNIALLAKWIMKIEFEDDSLCIELLRRKYLHDGGFFQCKERYASQFWKGLLNIRRWLSLGSVWQVGDGSHISFWRDVCGENSFVLRKNASWTRWWKGSASASGPTTARSASASTRTRTSPPRPAPTRAGPSYRSYVPYHIRFLQVQSVVVPVMASSAATAICHVAVCWALVFKAGMGSRGAAGAEHCHLAPSCRETWTGFSMDAFRELRRFTELAIPSAMMVWSENDIETERLLGWQASPVGTLPASVRTSNTSLNTGSLMFMVPFGLCTAIRKSNLKSCKFWITGCGSRFVLFFSNSGNHLFFSGTGEPKLR